MSDTKIRFSDLPAVGAELDDGIFCGLTTDKTGTHLAIVLLPARPDKRLNWEQATAWAKKAGGALPTRPVSALLYALAKHQFEVARYWTADELDGSYAWDQFFYYGDHGYIEKSYESRAVAVRLIEVIA